VARIIDGDGLRLAGDVVRLAGIDAPERDQNCSLDGRSYPCGRESADRLAGLIEGRQVRCEPERRDRYARLLARCSAAGVDLNRRMVETGWAVGYEDYEAQEQAARQARLGLWRGQFERPREFRRNHGDALGWWSWWPW
jgi:endonuclease YncB( thermonuclease family)